MYHETKLPAVVQTRWVPCPPCETVRLNFVRFTLCSCPSAMSYV